MLALFAFAAFVAPSTGDWTYVEPAPDTPIPEAHLRSLEGSESCPEDLQEPRLYRGTLRTYYELRYGEPGAPRMAIVLDRIDEGSFDLYVDRNSDRAVDSSERLPESGSVWRTRLPAAMSSGDEFELEQRAVVLRVSADGSLLQFGALGHFEGELEWRGEPVRAMRVDGDSNGFFTDAVDRVWIDGDGDGELDPWAEQFLFAPVLRVGDASVVLRSDAYGRQLTVTELAGTGTVQLALHAPYRDGRPAESVHEPLDLSVVLVGRDGSTWTLSNAETELPEGEYRVAAVRVRLSDPHGDLPWNFVFTRSGARAGGRWFAIAPDETSVVDPIGALDWVHYSRGEEGEPVPSGGVVAGGPRLYTADGLNLNRAWRGAESGGDYGRLGGYQTEAEIQLTSIEGTPLQRARSGFV